MENNTLNEQFFVLLGVELNNKLEEVNGHKLLLECVKEIATKGINSDYIDIFVSSNHDGSIHKGKPGTFFKEDGVYYPSNAEM